MNHTQHIEVIRRKMNLLPRKAEEVARSIFKEVFQGDELQDDIIELVHQIYDFNPMELDEEMIERMEADIYDALWAHIINQLHELVRNTQIDTARSHRPKHARTKSLTQFP